MKSWHVQVHPRYHKDVLMSKRMKFMKKLENVPYIVYFALSLSQYQESYY